MHIHQHEYRKERKLLVGRKLHVGRKENKAEKPPELNALK